ncbi:helix-turn-helix domain-containing protein [Pontibacter sp. E15-1]|uniref:helix-turn-helix domain-containing protein n=1 Tax=Pontibacter sp. E15-1 TaxID=2919918 RepID=UPI001F4F23EF|nr:helix-turn-helix domain-containing protein [Pontibacter sp. E15-1]MCJ8165524.1 helix-turn-helix domain-containing protein [Pontibacter sp. E15-1]
MFPAFAIFALVITDKGKAFPFQHFSTSKKVEMELQHLEQELQSIKTLLLSQKTVFNFDEAAAYTGLSKSYLYKMTCAAQVPHYKPQGKHIYFNKTEVDQWLQRNPVKPVNHAELEEQAATYVALKNMGRGK